MPLKRPVWMMGKESSTMHILFETLPCVRKIYNCIYIPSRHVLPARDARNANATSVMILLYEVRRHSSSCGVVLYIPLVLLCGVINLEARFPSVFHLHDTSSISTPIAVVWC